MPPDHTRLHSRSGEIAGCLYETLTAAGCEVGVLPALGTHAAMSPRPTRSCSSATRIPFERILVHRWRDGLAELGELPGDEIAALSRGRLAEPIPVEVDEQLLDGWDLVVSIGQVVPHEVVGTAGFTKNLVIGLGGGDTIHRSHFLGAVCGMETLMGRAQTPVRDAIDAAFDRFLAARVNVLWILTVTEDTPDGVVLTRALRRARRLRRLGRRRLPRGGRARGALQHRPSSSSRSTAWSAGSTRRSSARRGSGTRRSTGRAWPSPTAASSSSSRPASPASARTPQIDALIRRHGYRGTPATLDAVASDPELAANLGAAAHLIHGSSEGRFRITYCTDPTTGGLTAAEVEAVGYGWRPLPEELDAPSRLLRREAGARSLGRAERVVHGRAAGEREQERRRERVAGPERIAVVTTGRAGASKPVRSGGHCAIGAQGHAGDARAAREVPRRFDGVIAAGHRRASTALASTTSTPGGISGSRPTLSATSDASSRAMTADTVAGDR